MSFRPATPGLIVTLAATILLAIVSFNVPFLKSIFFLKASLTVNKIPGSITLGTLGYCLQLPNGTTCSSPSIGYKFNPNALLGDNISFAQIPTVVVKWITYALFLHVVAFILAAVTALFGLLMHLRELATYTYCSNCSSGLATSVAFVAFIFDIVLFFLVKSRVNNIQGASASLGNAIWLTLAAWVLLAISRFAYMCGSRCYSARPNRHNNRDHSNREGEDGKDERMRMGAIKADEERGARQQEVGLPAFPSQQEALKPLHNKAQYLDESDEEQPFRDGQSTTSRNGAYRGGYAQAPPGSRAVDEYYLPTQAETNMRYPPTPQHNNVTPPPNSRSPPVDIPMQNEYYQGFGYNTRATSPPLQQQQNHYPPLAQYNPYYDPYSESRAAASPPQSIRYSLPTTAPLGQTYSSPLATSAYSTMPAQNNRLSQISYITYRGQASASPPPRVQSGLFQPERNYSLGGTGYNMPAPVPVASGSSGVGASVLQQQQQQHSSPPPQQNTYTSPLSPPPSPGMGAARNTASSMQYNHPIYDDSPPTYDAGPMNSAEHWNSRGPSVL